MYNVSLSCWSSRLEKPASRGWMNHVVGLSCFYEATKWATAVLSQPSITIESRHRRIELFLQALGMCRLLSSKTDGVTPRTPVIRSFVETMLSTAILSPESRMFQRAWNKIALQRHSGIFPPSPERWRAAIPTRIQACC